MPPPHVPPRSRALLNIPPPLPPTIGWLLCFAAKWRPPKADAPRSSLFFEVASFCPRNGRTSRRVAKPDTARLPWTHRERRNQDPGLWRCCHEDRGQCSWRVGRRRLILMLCVVGCGLCCGLASARTLRYPFCRPTTQNFAPPLHAEAMKPPQR